MLTTALTNRTRPQEMADDSDEDTSDDESIDFPLVDCTHFICTNCKTSKTFYICSS